MIDDALTGHEIVIEHYHKPKAVIVSYDEWQTMKVMKRRETARRRAKEMQGNPAMRIPLTKEELIK